MSFKKDKPGGKHQPWDVLKLRAVALVAQGWMERGYENWETSCAALEGTYREGGYVVPFDPQCDNASPKNAGLGLNSCGIAEILLLTSVSCLCVKHALLIYVVLSNMSTFKRKLVNVMDVRRWVM